MRRCSDFLFGVCTMLSVNWSEAQVTGHGVFFRRDFLPTKRKETTDGLLSQGYHPIGRGLWNTQRVRVCGDAQGAGRDPAPGAEERADLKGMRWALLHDYNDLSAAARAELDPLLARLTTRRTARAWV